MKCLNSNPYFRVVWRSTVSAKPIGDYIGNKVIWPVLAREHVPIPRMKRRAKAMGASHSSDPVAKRRSGSSGSLSTISGSGSQIFPVPLEIVEEIFLNLPADQVVCVCRLVCQQWKDVADSESLWRERCRREGFHPCDASATPEDWRWIYFLCKKPRNLIKNPRAQQKMKDWDILENGGDRWKVEDPMVPHPNRTVKKNFVTSFGMCMKSQLIDLKMEGYTAMFMDHFQPDIKISDWYAPRWDCGSEYEICVELLNQKKEPIQTFAPNTIYFEQWNDQKWNQMIHVFKDYGPGVRYIRFTHGGKDTQFWAGWYGIRVTDSSIEICPRGMES